MYQNVGFRSQSDDAHAGEVEARKKKVVFPSLFHFRANCFGRGPFLAVSEIEGDGVWEVFP